MKKNENMCMNRKVNVFIRNISILLCVILFFISINIYITNNMRGDFETNNEFLRTIDCAPIFDCGYSDEYIIEFEAKAKKSGKVLVYQQNGSEHRYSFEKAIEISTEYMKYQLQVEPKLTDVGQQESFLAFYGYYGSGVVPMVKNIKILDLDGNELTNRELK